ncbi:hypothetical protein HYALB_00002591 [Hymenoscyphus albidus]|uniref:O-methyltransferase C-terminal domain-containing protein n=1 Tax=Hymenoscyphus albidus TaxID=595503 RepID=A0A9N9LYI6_9HELO|nr:hypothetical protein HYALB_00002591 [Hymenoscyphus albidus]
MFPWLSNHPQHLANFQAMMDSRYTNPRTWFDVYPIKERLISGLAAYMHIQPRPTKDSDVLLVGIGGSIGSDMFRFMDYLDAWWIESKGKAIEIPAGRIRFVLQDLPAVVEKIDCDALRRKHYKINSLFEFQGHDFFDVNPVKGARAYYIHAVLRDYDDDECTKILVNIRKSMKRGWSRLLLQEWVIPSSGANFRATRTDMAMMALNSRKERTAGQWEALLVVAGLKIAEIYEIDRGFESLIEAEMA